MKKAVQHWLDHSDYDLGTAQAMLSSGRFLYVFFCCQQSVEKALKALIACRNNELPPKIHNLVELARKAELATTPAQAELLTNLHSWYIETRYGEDIRKRASGTGKKAAKEMLESTEELLAWIRSNLKYSVAR